MLETTKSNTPAQKEADRLLSSGAKATDDKSRLRRSHDTFVPNSSRFRLAFGDDPRPVPILDRQRGRCARPDGLSRFEELSRREAARTAILYAFDLIEYDGEDLRISCSWTERLPRATAAQHQGGHSAEQTHCQRWGDRVRPRVPAWRRGSRFEDGRWHLSVRTVPRVDQRSAIPQASPCSGSEAEIWNRRVLTGARQR
jgi:hypothetical protein